MTLLKNIYIRFLLTLLVVFTACEDFEDDRLKFEETAAPSYVKFASVTKKSVVEGKSLNVQVDTPLQPYEDITVNYEITGDYATTGSVVIPAGSRNATFAVAIPENNVANAARKSVVKITSASGGYTAGRTTGIATSFELDILDDTKKAGFQVDSTGGFETDDKVNVIVALSNPADSKVTVSYVITGGDEGVHYEDVGGGVVEIAAGTQKDTIKLEILDNLVINNPPATLKIEIQSVSAADLSDTETTLDVEAKTFKYTIVDDLKRASFADGDVVVNDLTKSAGLGVHSFAVAVTGSSNEPVTVNYSVTGTGVTDLTGGSLTFYPGSLSTKQIEIQLEESAFSADQTVTIQLTSITSDDGEALVDNTGDEVQINIKN